MRLMLTLLFLYVAVSYVVGYELFITGSSKSWKVYTLWALSPIVVIPALILLFVLG